MIDEKIKEITLRPANEKGEIHYSEADCEYIINEHLKSIGRQPTFSGLAHPIVLNHALDSALVYFSDRIREENK